MKLNLGAGGKRIDGYTSVDFFHPDADLKVDLFKFPWPWPDNSVDDLVTWNFIEHLPWEIEDVWAELWRVVKPGGTIWIRVPHYTSPVAVSSGHRHVFSCWSFMEVANPTSYNRAEGLPRDGALWKLTSLRLTIVPPIPPFCFVSPINLLGRFRPWWIEWFIPCRCDSIEWKAVKALAAPASRAS